MSFCRLRLFSLLLICTGLLVAPTGAQTPESSSSSSPKHIKKPAAAHAESVLDAGTVANGLYRNKTFAFTCKIPAGWVLRTEEMNARESESDPGTESKSSPQ